MKLCVQLFFIFCKIGLFTLGGGYAMLPLMEEELTVRRTWLTKQDFLDLTALAQSAPGILAVNMAIFTGYKLAGIWGALWAACGAVLPSFIIILAIAICFQDIRQNPIINRIFMGIRPAVVALSERKYTSNPLASLFLVALVCMDTNKSALRSLAFLLRPAKVTKVSSLRVNVTSTFCFFR